MNRPAYLVIYVGKWHVTYMCMYIYVCGWVGMGECMSACAHTCVCEC